MFLVGLTGGIATGKSTVVKMFKDLGCPIIDADIIARKVVEPGRPASVQIRKTFGDEVFHEDGQLNRERLGQIIFQDGSKRKQLNAITHPKIKKTMLWEVFLCFLKGHQFAILDIPLLFETKQMLPFVSSTIVVYCEEDQQLYRLMERNNFTESGAKSRIGAQLPLSEKRRLATYEIDNRQNLDHTKQEVLKVHKSLVSSVRHIFIRCILLSILSVTVGSCAWMVGKLL